MRLILFAAALATHLLATPAGAQTVVQLPEVGLQLTLPVGWRMVGTAEQRDHVTMRRFQRVAIASGLGPVTAAANVVTVVGAPESASLAELALPNFQHNRGVSVADLECLKCVIVRGRLSDDGTLDVTSTETIDHWALPLANALLYQGDTTVNDVTYRRVFFLGRGTGGFFDMMLIGVPEVWGVLGPEMVSIARSARPIAR
jgi:hypothetical protein